MKTATLKVVLLAPLFGLMLFFSCKKEDNSKTQSQIETHIQNGTWKVTKFIDSDNDETNHFVGYKFVFNSSGEIHANNNNNSFLGSWSITDSNSNDDRQDDLNFNIFFNLSNDFEDLNDDWSFISFSSSRIELIYVSGGNGGIDYLTLEQY